MPTLLTSRAWGAHLVMLLALAAAVALGVWQLHVWSAHRSATQRDLTHTTPVALTSVMGGDSAFPGSELGRPVRLSGHWLDAHTMYVSGRTHQGTRGYWVVTPVLVGRSAMPVVRGWSPRPTSPAVHGPVAVTGWLEPSDVNGESDTNPHDDVITSLRIASMTQHVPVDLYSGYVVARTPTADLAAVPPPRLPSVSSTESLRNLLYAIQWWFFGGFAVYIWWRWCLDQLELAGRDTTDEVTVP